jgi:cytochrome c oxidase subunit II
LQVLTGLTPIAPTHEVVVTVLLVVSLRGQRDLPAEEDRLTGEGSAGGGNLLILVGGVIVPAAVVLLLMVLMITSGARVRALGNPSDALIIEVTGHKWWWDVEYPEAGVRTANEIRIPVGEPVEFRVTSADIIHSFWVPALAGKIDMTPGEENYLRVQADEPGVHRGLCTEYCGIQHALMHFIVVAQEPDEFEAWLAARAEPPPPPTDDLAREGLEVFEAAQCVLCHTVDGVSPETDLGPDLTDFGGRLTLGAGIAPNEAEPLAAWILDPHELKPGNHMPPSRLTDDELAALLAYLESLE